MTLSYDERETLRALAQNVTNGVHPTYVADLARGVLALLEQPRLDDYEDTVEHLSEDEKGRLISWLYHHVGELRQQQVELLVKMREMRIRMTQDQAKIPREQLKLF
jgi:hypothetical protein